MVHTGRKIGRRIALQMIKSALTRGRRAALPARTNPRCHHQNVSCLTQHAKV